VDLNLGPAVYEAEVRSEPSAIRANSASQGVNDCPQFPRVDQDIYDNASTRLTPAEITHFVQAQIQYRGCLSLVAKALAAELGQVCA